MYHVAMNVDDSPVTVVNRIVHRDVVALEVEAEVNGEWYFATGVARRHPEDTFNEQIGIKLAYARAFSDLARQLQRQADGAVKHAEDVALAKKQLGKRQQNAADSWDKIYQSWETYTPKYVYLDSVGKW